ncbi:hypothetical protein TSUD_253890 [Trifolium subterraneum]|uniref:Uncharacterized protein n=1 Tax=Trifolium subterraneum TaxID=3900 RepID=A0A2Z6NNH9_TRISU|nr:hypothetical protein TSUD_253890 [Trifolium subterraneum]
MSMPPESVFPGSRRMPREIDFLGRFFHHPDHRSFWQRLHIYERVMVIISLLVGAAALAALIYWVIYPRIIQLWQWWHSPQARSHTIVPLPAAIELQPPPILWTCGHWKKKDNCLIEEDIILNKELRNLY